MNEDDRAYAKEYLAFYAAEMVGIRVGRGKPRLTVKAILQAKKDSEKARGARDPGNTSGPRLLEEQSSEVIDRGSLAVTDFGREPHQRCSLLDAVLETDMYSSMVRLNPKEEACAAYEWHEWLHHKFWRLVYSFCDYCQPHGECVSQWFCH